MNVGAATLTLQEYVRGCDGLASADRVQIKPGLSTRVSSYERHCWRARDAATDAIVAEWTVDRADGLVQDLLLPFSP
jgi:hypothetical protein